MTFNVKDFGALGDGATDDAASINSAISCVCENGGGSLFIPAGVYIVGSPVVLRSNVTLQGAGLGATIIKQKASTALTSCVQSLNAYSLFGTSSLSGPAALNIRDLTIDGNRQNGATGDGLAIYGPLFSIDNIEVCNASGIGVRTEFGTPGAIGHGFCAQSNMNNCWVHDCNVSGVMWAGPADPSIVNCNIYRNLNYNLWLSGPAGSGCKVLNCHVWGSTFDGRQATTGIRIDSAGNLICNTVAEGSTVHQIHLRSSANYIIGGNLYYHSDSRDTYGVTLGDTGVPVTSNTIMARIDNCRAGAIYFVNSMGMNKIDVQGYNSGPSVGYTGAVSTPYSDWINLQVSGDAPVSNGRLTFLPGFGPITPGGINSGGPGYRALLSPN